MGIALSFHVSFFVSEAVYDVGTGNSSSPNGIDEVQSPLHIATMAVLVNSIQDGLLGYEFSRIVSIGHSYGRYGKLFTFISDIHFPTDTILVYCLLVLLLNMGTYLET